MQVGVGSSKHEHARPMELSTELGKKLVTAAGLQCS